MTVTANGAGWYLEQAMSNTEVIAFILAGLHAVVGIFYCLKPKTFERLVLALPRNRWAGYLLTAATLICSSWVLYHMPLGRFEQFRVLFFPLTPAVFLLICYFMEELLAARALGGLLLLLAAPVLDALRWEDSMWRLVITTWAYFVVVAGMWLVLSPYRFRRFWAWFFDGRRTLACSGFFALAGLFVLVGLLSV